MRNMVDRIPRRHGRPPCPWMDYHVAAVMDSIRRHFGLGDYMTCWPDGQTRPCCMQAIREWPGYERVAVNLLKALQARKGRLTWKQFDAAGIALEHAKRHGGHAATKEALGILDAWMRDYDRRILR